MKKPMIDVVSGEHADAYSEVCQQFSAVVLDKFLHDVQRVTIMRDLPVHLQINAALVGSLVGALVPLLSLTKPADDRELVAAIAEALPDAVAASRKMLEERGL